MSAVRAPNTSRAQNCNALDICFTLYGALLLQSVDTGIAGNIQCLNTFPDLIMSERTWWLAQMESLSTFTRVKLDSAAEPHYYRESVLGLQTGSTAKTCLAAFANLILSLSAFQRMKSAKIMAWLYVIECVSKVQQRQKVLLQLQTGSTAKSCLTAPASASLYCCCLLYQLSSRDLLRSEKERKSKPQLHLLSARERRTFLMLHSWSD